MKRQKHITTYIVYPIYQRFSNFFRQLICGYYVIARDPYNFIGLMLATKTGSGRAKSCILNVLPTEQGKNVNVRDVELVSAMVWACIVVNIRLMPLPTGLNGNRY